MKLLKFLNSVAVALLFIVIFSQVFSLFGIPVKASATVLCVAAIWPLAAKLAGYKFQMPIGMYAGVYREVWTGEMVKRLNTADNDSFLNGLQDKSRYVTGDQNAQVIHMTYLGVVPDVLINNTTYPLDIQAIGDADIAINLDKYQTKATPVTDDELFAISYPRIQAVNETHAVAIAEKKQAKALHSLAPAGNTAALPVLLTTGADDGTGRRMLTLKDLVRFKTAIDKLKIPIAGRRLVLCPDHIGDLLQLEQKFSDQFYNYSTGMIARMHSFELFEHVDNPFYVPATKVKKSFGAVPAGTDRQASIFFHTQRSVTATGLTKMYWSKSETDPLNQQSLINYRNYFIAMRMREEAGGALVSDNV